MDAFEPIRSAAAALHQELVAKGADPLIPLALVETAVGDLDLELVWLPAGDPALKGARALYDDQSGSICCQSGGNESERALLVAHEIGHARLHAGSATCAAAEDRKSTRLNSSH